MALSVCEECGTRYAVGVPACPNCSSTMRVEDGTVGTVPVLVTTACTTRTCRYEGIRRQVALRLAALGVAELPTLVCVACGSHLPVTWPGPAEGEKMPKITRHGGATNAAEDLGKPVPPAVVETPAPVKAAEPEHAKAVEPAEPAEAKPKTTRKASGRQTFARAEPAEAKVQVNGEDG